MFQKTVLLIISVLFFFKCHAQFIELHDYRYVLSNDGVKIIWAAKHEEKVDHYTIERSSDGAAFESVRDVTANHHDLQLHYYSYTDFEPYSDSCYYRLRALNTSNSNEYFELLKYINRDVHLPKLKANAEGGLINYSFDFTTKPVDEAILVVVYDVYGNEKYAKVFVAADSDDDTKVYENTHQLTPGVYYVTASNERMYLKKKLVVN